MGELMRRALKWGALALFVGVLAGPAAAQAEDNRAPDVGEYVKLKAPAGHMVKFHAYAEGVQIYGWNGTSWVFLRPQAMLYAGTAEDDAVGIHYGGPTWESNSGSYVVGRVSERATPNPNAIQWLLLEAVDSDGPGIFDGVTYIQRVNTVGGLAPSDPGEVVGEVARMPYTADYYFYRAQ